MRRPLLVANWKMNMTCAQAVAYLNEFLPEIENFSAVDVVICPPFTALRSVSTFLEYEKSPVMLGSQNIHWEEKGAFTGEISAEMLTELRVGWAIVGHSERRRYFGETDESVAKRAAAAVRAGITPIVCVGESLEEREDGRTAEVIQTQTLSALNAIRDAGGGTFALAYEPVWAIGTGRAAFPEQANDVTRHMRALVGTVFSPEVAREVRILYGGSVDADNIADFLNEPDIDGALVGGASLSARHFSQLVRIAS